MNPVAAIAIESVAKSTIDENDSVPSVFVRSVAKAGTPILFQASCFLLSIRVDKEVHW
jgi:hypothetical protein